MVVVEIIIKNNYLKKIKCLRVHWWILGKKEKGKERNLLGCLVGWIGQRKTSVTQVFFS